MVTFRQDAGAGESRLERLSTLFGVRPGVTSEWAWIVGRLGLTVVAGAGVVAFLRDSPPFTFLLWTISFVFLYDAVLAGLMLRGRVHATFFAGLVLDTVVILLAWAVTTEGVSAELEPTDIYLIMFPIVVVAVIRLGWPLGVVQGTIFIAWMAGTAIKFLPSDHYDVEQMPLRVLFLAATMGLTLWLMERLNAARDQAERLAGERATLAEMGRVIGSTLELGQVYDRFAALVHDLVPYRRITIDRSDPETGQLVHAYSHGEPGPDGNPHLEPGGDGTLERVVAERAGSLFDDEQGRATWMAVPLVSADRVVGTLGVEAHRGASFGSEDLLRLQRVAHQVSPAIESSRLAEDLVRSEGRLRSVLDSSYDAVMTVDPSGVVSGVNAGAVQMFGHGALEMEGRPLSDLLPGLDSDEGQPAGAAPSGRAVEVTGRRAGGATFPAEAVTARLSAGGDGTVITLRDITERKSAEDARMRVLQTVAHELRTPLSAVRGAKDLLTSTSPDDLDSFTFRRLMGIMNRGVDRLDMLGQELGDLVDLIDMQRGTIQLDRERVRLSNVVDTALAQAEPDLARQEHDVQLSLSQPGTELWVDHRRMVQVVHCLLINAHRSSPRGTTIVMSGRRTGAVYELKVRDQGPEIASEDRPYIFDPYSRGAEQALRSNDVRGFRLAIARGFVEEHGGEIGFETGPGGSEFFVHIPFGSPVMRDGASRTAPISIARQRRPGPGSGSV